MIGSKVQRVPAWLAAGLFAGFTVAGQAHASSGCTAVNAGGYSFGVAAGANTSRTVTGFATGDTITFTVTRATFVGGDGVSLSLFDGVATLYSSPDNNAVSESTTVTFSATSVPSLTATLDSFGVSATVMATCVAAVVAPTGPTDSQKLRSLQIQGSKIVAQTSGAAIGTAVDDAIASALDGGQGTGTTGGNALGAPAGLGRKPQTHDAPAPTSGAFAVRRNGWTTWGDLRFTGSRRQPDAGGFQGNQVNGTFGVGRVVVPGLVIGAFGGAERFGYDVASLNGKLTGNGTTGGTYLGWRFVPGLRFDLAGGFSGLNYNASAGTAAGNFTGQRKLLTTGVTGNTNFGGFMLEPSARLFAIWEHQDAYTDNLGVAQATNNFSVGRASAGLRIARPWLWDGGVTLTPYAGLYGDYRFSRGQTVTAGTEILALPDGWSARAMGGLSLGTQGGATVSVGGEWGGLGTTTSQRTLTVRGAVPF